MEIKTKILVTIATLLTISSTSSFAKTKICHYSDFFHLSADSPAGMHLVNNTSDSNIVVRPLSDSFYLEDAPSCPRNGGNATITYAIGNQAFCSVFIHDGAYELHPKVVATDCHGLSFSDLSSDGIFTYKYTLHFRK